MPDIDPYLQAIMDARYGEEVRSSIHDAIEEINDVVDEADVTILRQDVGDLTNLTTSAKNNLVSAINEVKASNDTNETITWKQGLNVTANTSTNSGVTFTKNGDGSWTMTGKATGTYRKPLANLSSSEIVVGHKYAILLRENFSGIEDKWYLCFTRNGSSMVYIYTDMIWTANTTKDAFSIRVHSGIEFPEGGATVWPQYFDLTAMFGAGNEPKTIDEFKAMFPNTYYPYSAAIQRKLTFAEKLAWELEKQKPITKGVSISASSWSGSSATISVTSTKGITSRSIVYASPADSASNSIWINNKVLLSSVGTDSVTFTAATDPTSTLNVKLIIW